VTICLPLTIGHRLLAVALLSAPNLKHPPTSLSSALNTAGGQGAAAIEALEARLSERDRLTAASRAQQLAMAGQLAASVAHEVRNPLATISSSVEYALNSPSDWSSKTEVLRDVMGEIDRINRTLSGMLSLTRPQPPELTDLDLATLVEEGLRPLQSYVDHHQISLILPSAGPTLSVRADAGQIRQVLLNVLLNACQATPSGGRIHVLTKAERPDPASGGATGEAVVVITDSGPGVPAEQLTRVFDPFFTTKPAGTGLGLSTSLEIMKAHGGWIRLESTIGHGTTVVLTLPLRET
jgi:signal transduction histidine kinase